MIEEIYENINEAEKMNTELHQKAFDYFNSLAASEEGITDENSAIQTAAKKFNVEVGSNDWAAIVQAYNDLMDAADSENEAPEQDMYGRVVDDSEADDAEIEADLLIQKEAEMDNDDSSWVDCIGDIATGVLKDEVENKKVSYDAVYEYVTDKDIQFDVVAAVTDKLRSMGIIVEEDES